MNKDFARGMIVSMALKALPVRKKSPIAYLYNGVRLPALPEWDREAYPYAVICDSSSITAPEQYRLFVSAYPFVRNGDNERITTSVVDSEGFNWYCTIESRLSSTMLNVWTDFDEITFTSAFSQKGVWANHDILDANGEVYLAASTPIPIYNEPVNYLYNGVKLTKLPEWDKTVYPYAMITDQIYFGVPYRLLRVFSTFDDSDGAVTYSNSMWCNSFNGGPWSEWTETEGTTEKAEIIWSNFDVHNADGTVKLSASEPVPIYE